jgi:hypothetical protein
MEEVKLYSPKQIGLACFFGTPVASLAMMATNFKAASKPGKRNVAYIISLVLLPFMIYSLVQLAEKNIYRILIFFASAFMAFLADQLQGDFFKRHIENDGKIKTVWSVIKVIAACDIIIIFLTFMVLLFLYA